jgi:hypothetical protein
MNSSNGANGPIRKAIQNHTLDDLARRRAIRTVSGTDPIETISTKTESQSIRLRPSLADSLSL